METNKSEDVKSFFDDTGKYLHKDFGVKVRADITRDLLGSLLEGKKVIDVGCGNGGVTLQFLDKVETLHYLDISDKMLELVKMQVPQQYAHKTAFFNCDLEQLDVNQKYDVIIAWGLIMHVNSPMASMQKMAELLKPDGILLTQYTNYSHPISRLNKLIGGKGGYKTNDINRGIFKQLAEKAGFKITKSFSYSWMLRGLGNLPDGFLYKFHKWTYKAKWAGSLGIDDVYLMEKK